MAKRRITLFIGPTERSTLRLRRMFDQHRAWFQAAGVEAPSWNHVRLYTACADPEDVGVLRYRRGLNSPLAPKTLTWEFETLLSAQMKELKGDHVVLAAAQMGGLLHRPDEIGRLHTLLSAQFDDIRIVAHVDDQARMLAHHYAVSVRLGRCTPLTDDLAHADAPDWMASTLKTRKGSAPDHGVFADLEAPPFWLDYAELLSLWETTFGRASVELRPLSALFDAENAMEEVATVLELEGRVPKTAPARFNTAEPAVALERMRQINEVLIRLSKARDIIIPQDLRAQIHAAVQIAGPPLEPGSLALVSNHFRDANTALTERFPALRDALTPTSAGPTYTTPDPAFGFRPTQYVVAFDHAIRRHATPIAQRRAERAEALAASAKFDRLFGSDAAQPPETLERIKVNHQMILTSQFRPHNALETSEAADHLPAYTTAVPSLPTAGSSGKVIVACMKDEAPYILEWIAYHRSIGVDQFLIYTNDCNDGTGRLLDRLAELGIVQHRNNDRWKGRSPQQHALNRAIDESVVRDADWIAHIDVDEFINVRTGNGTLEDLFAATHGATHIAMTWRLFGHNGVDTLENRFVTEQFDHCAPSYCPKPHTVWGFKTLFRNDGAYQKLSCHRPNKIDPSKADQVRWVNGSGKDITPHVMQNGWRSSQSTVGYDLVQLNHYALRSAEGFLIKRQRGRALHVNRQIGLNYWIRMDWGTHRDETIKRNLPRLRACFDTLMRDPEVRAAHEAGLEWHRQKAAELRATPEFGALYDKALSIDLSATERAAYALALDMES